MIFKSLSSPKLISFLKSGKVGVLPTDTIYGLVGQAFNKKAVSRIYKIKGRKPDKPFIILINSVSQVEIFKIKLNTKTKKFLQKVWPGKVSVILPYGTCHSELVSESKIQKIKMLKQVQHDKRVAVKKFSYLHRGTKTLAFRFPAKKSLINLILKTGPLVAPSVNPEGSKPAKDIKEAQGYFDKKVDFYVDAGRLVSEPSTLIKMGEGKIKILRQGAKRIQVLQ